MKITLVGDIFPADEFLSVGFGIRSQFEATKGERWKDNIQGITQDSDIVITRVRDKDCVKNRVKRAKIVRFTLC